MSPEAGSTVRRRSGRKEAEWASKRLLARIVSVSAERGGVGGSCIGRDAREGQARDRPKMTSGVTREHMA
jgi:hypothetical protein